MFELTGRVAIVTGGNGGIGLGVARGLARAGARIVIAARDQEKSNAALRTLGAFGSEALALSVDISSEKSVEKLVSRTVEQCGRLDILVNNAGINIRKPVHELDLREWQLVIDT
ncbi:MAG TPA: SDR family NAD(P)-dependent oxidoreductase, partial [Terriglobia bacterium]|nr:SDR family NAD(P)-dependent oxidoreductase [Terriglobia bacterium]